VPRGSGGSSGEGVRGYGGRPATDGERESGGTPSDDGVRGSDGKSADDEAVTVRSESAGLDGGRGLAGGGSEELLLELLDDELELELG
jgi:hypothetical protein